MAAFAIGSASALWWWAGTEGSLGKALRWVGQSQPLIFERATGSLSAGGQVGRLRWQQDGITVEAHDVSLAWQPWFLLKGTLKLDRIAAARVDVADERPPQPAPTAPPKALGLPLQIVLEEFSVGQFQYAGRSAVTASVIAGSYRYNGLQHQLDLNSLQVANGRYSGRAALTSTSPLTLDASLSGALAVDVPDNPTPVLLAFQATVTGPLTELLLKTELQGTAASQASVTPLTPQPQASATARITPWAAQPLLQADASFRGLDLMSLLPQAPRTLLTGSASVRPLDSSSPAWTVALQLVNALPGPWDQQRLPIDKLDTQGEWKNNTAMIRSLKAELAGGELLANGQWLKAPPANKPATGSLALQDWQLKATLKRINPAQLHT